MIQVKRETTVKKITRMSIKNDHYMRNVGKMPNLSAICIQKAYRRYRIRCKLYRLKQTYETLQVLKEEENYRSLREKIRNIYCYTYIKTLRFERYRRNCLALIRKNLARIKIKIVFRKLKLKFPIIIAKIKKYKRRLRAALKRKMRRREGVNANNIEGIFEHSSTLVEEKEASINSEEDFETTTSDREAEEREEMLKKMEEERKMRIHFGKISYNCPDFKLPKILTSLHQKEVNFPTESSPLPTISPIKKKKIINFESKRRKNLNDGPSYMRATVSYNLSKSDAKQDDYEPFNLSKVTPRENSTVMDPTKTYLLKVTHKRSASTDEGAKNFHFGDAGTSSPKLISVKIAKKKNFPKKWTKQASEDFSSVKPENVRFSMTLPDISTQYNQLPLKVKPRAQIMKGFAKSKKIPEYYFDI